MNNEPRLSRSSLTPMQNVIEDIIENTTFTQEQAAEMLRALSNMNEQYKADIHWHSSPYIKHLVCVADSFISDLTPTNNK